MENTKFFTFKLNNLQFETIRNLFNHCDWNFEECLIGKKSFDAVSSNDQLYEFDQQSGPLPSTSGAHDTSDNNNNDDNDGDGGDDSGGESDDSSNSQGACSFCFLSPCVTTHRQLWLPDQPAHPHPRNSELRKQRYRKFWKLVDMNGGWRHHKYISKKRRLLGLDDSATVWVGVGSVREVMPQCILDLVRGIYPNPPGQPYMGHKWW